LLRPGWNKGRDISVRRPAGQASAQDSRPSPNDHYLGPRDQAVSAPQTDEMI